MLKTPFDFPFNSNNEKKKFRTNKRKTINSNQGNYLVTHRNEINHSMQKVLLKSFQKKKKTTT